MAFIALGAFFHSTLRPPWEGFSQGIRREGGGCLSVNHKGNPQHPRPLSRPGKAPNALLQSPGTALLLALPTIPCRFRDWGWGYQM